MATMTNQKREFTKHDLHGLKHFRSRRKPRSTSSCRKLPRPGQRAHADRRCSMACGSGDASVILDSSPTPSQPPRRNLPMTVRSLRLAFTLSARPRVAFMTVVVVMPALLAAVACLLMAGASGQARGEEAAVIAPPEPADMQELFDGSDLDGWDGDPRLWSVREGVIHGETTPEDVAAGNTFLIWQGGEIEDFDLRLSFRCNSTNNSGIQYRSKHISDTTAKNKWVVRGYQHEIRNEETFPNVSGFIYDEGGSRQRICQVGEQATWEADGKKIKATLISQEDFTKLMKVDDWNDVVIRAEGNRVRHYLNGRLILDFTDNNSQTKLTKGVLALQLHGGQPMWAEYRSIRLKSL